VVGETEPGQSFEGSVGARIRELEARQLVLETAIMKARAALKEWHSIHAHDGCLGCFAIEQLDRVDL